MDKIAVLSLPIMHSPAVLTAKVMKGPDPSCYQAIEYSAGDLDQPIKPMGLTYWTSKLLRPVSGLGPLAWTVEFLSFFLYLVKDFCHLLFQT